MNYDEITAVKLNAGGVMLFTAVTAQRKQEIIDAGDYERVIKRGEYLKSNETIIQATERSNTSMNLENMVESQILKMAEKDPKSMIDTLNKQLLDDIAKLKSGGMGHTAAFSQVMTGDKAKRFDKMKRAIEQQDREKRSIAGKTELAASKAQLRNTKAEIYDQYTAAVKSGDTKRADSLAAILKDA